MMDTCVIYRVTSRTKNTRGIYELTFDGGTESICGVQMEPQMMYEGQNMQTADVDIVLRLPLGTEVAPQDEIEITHRFGERINPKRYEVMRYTNDGPSGCRAYLKVRNIQ